ncbi:MAG: hypothetical protein IJK79_00095 [Bacteroidales bacterium]|nr:hypothetical protein [Bacteroidales bacterium]MBR0300988.1 hypothetical protein [Bacteroidales bacterium]
MSLFNRFFVLLAVVWLLPAPDALAGVKPEWVQKGEEAMNRKRTNDSYVFKAFHQADADYNRLMDGRFDPLIHYVASKYRVERSSVQLDSLVAGAGVPVTYRIAFRDAEGEAVVLAQRVDSYLTFEDFNDQEFRWEHDQLFAVSEKNRNVVFDCYGIESANNGLAALMSVVPGVGQLYKGNTAKGLVILGSEVALGAAAAVFQLKAYGYQKRADAGEFPADSWQSKADGYKLVRNISLGAMAGIWLFGIFDAVVGDGASRLKVEPATGENGVGVVYKF